MVSKKSESMMEKIVNTEDSIPSLGKKLISHRPKIALGPTRPWGRLKKMTGQPRG